MANILKVLKGPLSTLGKKNRNGRIYSKELWENVLKSEYWQDMIANNSLCGEVVHPGERTESDPFEIDVRNISHRIKEAHIEGDKLMGTVEVLDTEQGRNLLSLINSGVTVGISARGMGDLDGDYVVPDTYNFKCFDITMRPSDPNARLVPLTESERIKLKVINEAEESDILISEGTIPTTKQDRTKPSITKAIVTKLNDASKNKDLTFKRNKNKDIQALYKSENFGNIFINEVKSDSNNYQIDKYKVYTNKDKDFGYEYIPTRGSYPDSTFNALINKLIKSFESKIPEEPKEEDKPKSEQLKLDLDGDK